MPYVDDCVFCKILQKQIPSVSVYENELILAFLDIAPFNFGHALIVPKDHHHSCTTLGDDYLARMMQAAPRIAAAICAESRGRGLQPLPQQWQRRWPVVPHVPSAYPAALCLIDGVLMTASTENNDSTQAMTDSGGKNQAADHPCLNTMRNSPKK